MKLFKYREYVFYWEPSNSQDRTRFIPDTQICVCLGSKQPKESVSGMFSATSPLPTKVSDIQLVLRRKEARRWRRLQNRFVSILFLIDFTVGERKSESFLHSLSTRESSSG